MRGRSAPAILHRRVGRDGRSAARRSQSIRWTEDASMTDSTGGIGGAYDGFAGDYDRRLAGEQWMRDVLWRHYLRLFRPGAHVIDAGCGTGIDTVFLASRGVR